MRQAERQAISVVDLGYGDAGKGHLTQKCVVQYGAHTVVRANGGYQAGHNVYAPDGRHHTFAHVGAASFIPGVATHLSRHMLVSPMVLYAEAKTLQEKGVPDILSRITLSERAMVITPFHRAANRLREVARSLAQGRHGSCGFGIGEAMLGHLEAPERSVFVRDCQDKSTLRSKLFRQQEFVRAQLQETIRFLRDAGAANAEVQAEIGWITDTEWPHAIAAMTADEIMPLLDVVDDDWEAQLFRRPGAIVFEGSQGMLLDEWRGFHPYTTWSRCCNHNPYALLDEHGFDGARWTVGVTRAYATRHGAGPFVTEHAELTQLLPDSHNVMGDWQQNFRVGWLDLVALRYAVASCAHKVDALAMTCLDRLAEVPVEWRFCNRYYLEGVSARDVQDLFIPDDLIGGCAKDIRLGAHRDLAHQQRLTNAMQKVRPFIGHTGKRGDELASFMAELAGVPLKFVSSGKTVNDIKVL